jgi:hypothetical protein
MDWITNLHVAWWRLYIKHSARRYPVPMQTLLNPSNNREEGEEEEEDATKE